MTKYLVEARLTFEVEAANINDALRSVSASIQDRNVVQDRNAANVEYLVRQRNESAAPATLALDDYQELDKPVYTVAEVASILRTSRSSVYEMVRRGIKCIRMGRRVLISRGAVRAILSDEVHFNDRAVRPQAPPPRTRARRDEESRPEAIVPVQRRRTRPRAPEPNTPVSLTELRGIADFGASATTTTGAAQDLLRPKRTEAANTAKGARKTLPTAFPRRRCLRKTLLTIRPVASGMVRWRKALRGCSQNGRSQATIPNANAKPRSKRRSVHLAAVREPMEPRHVSRSFKLRRDS